MHRTPFYLAALAGIALGTGSCGERPAPDSREFTEADFSSLDSVPRLTRTGRWLKYYDVRNLVELNDDDLHLGLGRESQPPDPAAESLSAEVRTLAPAAEVWIKHGTLIVAMPRNEFNAVDRALEVRRRDRLSQK